MFLRKRRGTTTRADELTLLCETLLSHRGEVSGARLAADVVRMYRTLDGADVEAFLDRLATTFAADLGPVRTAVAQFQKDESEITLMRLQRAVEPPRQELFRR